jgi:NAD(P)H-dependent FMN reductase
MGTPAGFFTRTQKGKAMTAEEKRPRVLCIAGSPRRRGNSEQLLDALARGVRGAGGEPDVLAVSEFGIQLCHGCSVCTHGGTCILADRMQELYPRIDAADAIAVASPVYFATVPANLKAFYDRCQPYWARRFVLGEPHAAVPKRPGAFLLVRAGGDPYGCRCAVDPTKSVFAVLGVEYSYELAVEGPDLPGDIVKHPEALERAEEIGAALVADVLSRWSAAGE